MRENLFESYKTGTQSSTFAKFASSPYQTVNFYGRMSSLNQLLCIALLIDEFLTNE